MIAVGVSVVVTKMVYDQCRSCWASRRRRRGVVFDAVASLHLINSARISVDRRADGGQIKTSFVTTRNAGRRRADVFIHSRQLQLLLSARPWRRTISSVQPGSKSTETGWITSTSPQPPRCQRPGKDELVYGRRSCGQRRRWTDNGPVVRRVPCGNNNNVTIVYGASFFRAWYISH